VELTMSEKFRTLAIVAAVICGGAVAGLCITQGLFPVAVFVTGVTVAATIVLGAFE
jgi:energy-converting hydrogenase Eha subunit H